MTARVGEPALRTNLYPAPDQSIFLSAADHLADGQQCLRPFAALVDALIDEGVAGGRKH